ncbi:MAG: hypothetical protein H6793_01300 [Candidatus Nomurabacteria bacterium]|nr:MAG: hypothetical protein H6793_01300 [Candidatus Nomurabacteria bacterium]
MDIGSPDPATMYMIIDNTGGNNDAQSFRINQRLVQKIMVGGNQLWQPVVWATGGTITDIDVSGVMWRVHTFTSSGSFEVLQNNLTVEYLIVGGGGGRGGASNAGSGNNGASGGGGAGSVGGNATNGSGGIGGSGLTILINGNNVTYAVGGNGGRAGGSGSSGIDGATPGSGGSGGGLNLSGGAGASGIVIIRYQIG